MNDGPTRVLAATAILGYGYPLASFAKGLEHDPHVIGVDAGSTDPGAYYLGAGEPLSGAATVKRDLRPMVVAGMEWGVPVIVGTSGGAGATRTWSGATKSWPKSAARRACIRGWR